MYQEECQQAQRLQIYLLKPLDAGVLFVETTRNVVCIYTP